MQTDWFLGFDGKKLSRFVESHISRKTSEMWGTQDSLRAKILHSGDQDGSVNCSLEAVFAHLTV